MWLGTLKNSKNVQVKLHLSLHGSSFEGHCRVRTPPWKSWILILVLKNP